MCICVCVGGTFEFVNYKWEAEVTTTTICEEECLGQIKKNPVFMVTLPKFTGET